MNDVLDEVTNESITKEHVEKRITDWIKRLNSLFKEIESWLPKGWNSEQKKSVVMAEEMMEKFNIKSRKIPLLELKSEDGNATATLTPRGLWIIGSNGRVDLIVGDKHYLIIDQAENFAQPNWQIVNFKERKNFDKLTKSRFVAALYK
jgi:hypothetical protein